ncbi:MAG: hypothetical protein K2W96_27860 [Gemmataceae bacterium]|nr:hypothetical protein [Gemmataceae bacterium]
MSGAAWERLGAVLLGGAMAAGLGWLIFSAIHKRSTSLKRKLGLMVYGLAVASYLGTGIAFVIVTRHAGREPLYEGGVAGFGLLVGVAAGNLLQAVILWMVSQPPIDESRGPGLPVARSPGEGIKPADQGLRPRG